MDVVNDGDMTGLGGFQIVGTLVANIHQQGRRLTVDKSKDAVVHVVDIAGNGPVEALLQGVERPQSCIVTLGGDDLMGL